VTSNRAAYNPVAESLKVLTDKSTAAMLRDDMLMLEGAIRTHEHWARKSQLFDHNRKCLLQATKNVEECRKRVLDRMLGFARDLETCDGMRRSENT
jgi:hypothetical protein